MVCCLPRVSSQRSWPRWMVILIFLAVVATLGVTIGLLVHFLAVGKMHYYLGDFHLSGVTYRDSCDNAPSQASSDLSKHIETEAASEWVEGESQLSFKFPPGKRQSMRTHVSEVVYRMLMQNTLAGAQSPLRLQLWKSARLILKCCQRLRNNSDDWTVNFGIALNQPIMTIKLKNTIFHENYHSPAVHDDIALVQLAKEISFTKYIRRICLPEAKMKLSENDSVVVIGWGKLYLDGPSPVMLQEAVLKIIDNKNCNAPHALSGLVMDTMLCARYMSGEADACQNDSGGPLACPDSGDIWHLVGIDSWGEGCGLKNKPGVYTRVTSYHNWIASKTGL